MPLISIIIPVYNVETVLNRCLDSVVEQADQDMELILVDDGSTDESGKICDQYANLNSNIRVIHKANGGLASARNAGLTSACGEWISFVDSDDWVDAGCYKRIKRLLLNNAVNRPDIIKFGYRRIKGSEIKETVPCISPGMYGKKEIREVLIPAALGGGKISDSTINTIVLSACAHLYNRDFLDKEGISFVSEKIVGSEDFLFNYSLYFRAQRVMVTHWCCYNYWAREGSLTCRYRNNLFKQYRRLGSAVLLQLNKTGKYGRYKHLFDSLYIEFMYICIMNECASDKGKRDQLKKTKMILEDEMLKRALKRCRTPGLKSKMLVTMMKFKAVLPLCIIQWRKKGDRDGYLLQ